MPLAVCATGVGAAPLPLGCNGDSSPPADLKVVKILQCSHADSRIHFIHQKVKK
jgi:hypothetical protein